MKRRALFLLSICRVLLKMQYSHKHDRVTSFGPIIVLNEVTLSPCQFFHLVTSSVFSLSL